MEFRKKTFIGIDIGGTKIEGILWRAGRVVRVERTPTAKGKHEFLQSLFAMVEKLSQGESVQGAGFAVAGMVDIKRGVILRNRHFKFFERFPFLQAVKKQIKQPIRMDNDTKCFLLAETIFGAARGKRNVVGLTLGTGLGGAVMAEGRMIRGRHHGAAQLTRMFVFGDGEKPLTMENLVSSHGFARLGITDPMDCQRRAAAGEKKAIAVFQEIGKYLGIGLANIINIFDPELIVIGGGIARAGDLLMNPARKEMIKYTALPDLPPVKISKLKHTGALGAVALFAEGEI